MEAKALIDYLKQGLPINAKLVKQILHALGSAPEWRTGPAPKNKFFLARVRSYPWPVMCHYLVDGVFTWPEIAVEHLRGEQVDDYYFETTTGIESEIIAWMEMPEAEGPL